MSALDSGSLMIQYGNLFVGDDSASAVEVGAVRDVKFMGEPVRTRVLSDNRGEIVNKIRLQGNFEATLLEPGNMAILENIFKGLVTKAAVAGSIVNNYQQTVASGSWAYDKFIPFDKQNADGTYPNVDSVTLGTDGVIVLHTDYEKVKDSATGKWGIVIRDSSTVTTQSQSVVIQFDYTPATSLTLTGGTNQTATPRYIKIEGPSEDDSSVKRTIEITQAICNSPLLMEFVDVENGNDVGKMPVRFEGMKGVEWTITDAINPT